MSLKCGQKYTLKPNEKLYKKYLGSETNEILQQACDNTDDQDGDNEAKSGEFNSQHYSNFSLRLDKR